MEIIKKVYKKLGKNEDNIEGINIVTLIEQEEKALEYVADFLKVKYLKNKEEFDRYYNAEFLQLPEETDERYQQRLLLLNDNKVIPAIDRDIGKKIYFVVDPTIEELDKYCNNDYGIISLSTYKNIIGVDNSMKLFFDEQEDMPIFIKKLFKYCNDNGGTDIDITTMQSNLAIKLKVSGEWTNTVGVIPIAYKNKFLISLGSLASPNPIDYKSGKELKFRIGQDIDGINILFRIAVFPTTFGENVSIRKLPTMGSLPNINYLGLSEESTFFLSQIVGQINSPKKGGMVLITGETGSGKSTLLSAQVAEYLKLNKKVSTSEDPVENKQAHPFLNQTEVGEDAGLTHMDALAGFLRQNSDVIVIGECRRTEEFLAVINASLSGHFTYTTYHTGSVEDTLLRLRAMGIDLNLVAGTLKAIVSTNLIPKLCRHCKTKIGAKFIRNIKGECTQCKGKGVRGVVPVIEAASFYNPEVKRVITSDNLEHVMKVIKAQPEYISMKSQLDRLKDLGLVDARIKMEG